MWEWLQSLSGGAANFVGSFTGAAIGLVALLIGALFNAHLNRNRDDRLRKEETRAVAAALRAELAGIDRTLLRNAESLDKPEGGAFLTPDLAHSVRVMPYVIPKLGLLDVETIRKVVDAYIVVDQYCEQLILLGGKLDDKMPGHRRLVLMPAAEAKHVATMNRNISKQLQDALCKLDPYLY